MARSGIDSIDNLLAGKTQSPIGPGCTDAAAIGELQDILRCQGFAGMPAITTPGRGLYGPHTSQAVRDFRAANLLGDGDTVDAATLSKVMSLPASKPVASRCYLAMVLDIEPEGLAWIVCLTSQFESGRNFSRLCLNTDKAGLSFGLIQWAQKPGRLAEILRAFDTKDHARFVSAFGAGDERAVAGLLNLVSRANGGVDPKTGVATDPRFNLVETPWWSVFKRPDSIANGRRSSVRRLWMPSPAPGCG
jgi:peptidoglycan hydrolase-like protein with peptidoglycan-binding domain